ncbi:MAG: LamG domain-containing protein [Candidatus Poribacteria bacterium]|nr:LamG domain-containing protein [Candidatus Poribacteria bacterium]
MKQMCLFFILALMVFSANSYAELEDGLVSVWNFDDGSANDSIGSNDGEFMNGASTADGRHGMALNLDNPENPATGENTGQYVEIPSAASLEKEDGVFSVSLWVNVREGGGRDHAGMFFKGDKVGWGDHFMVRMCTTSDTNMTWGSCWEGSEGWFATNDVYAVDEWVHVAYVVNGTEATAYVTSSVTDGTVVPPSGQSNPRSIETPLRTFPERPVEIGVGRQVGGNAGNDFWLDGMIDEVYFWERALSEDEVKELADGATVGATVDVEAQGKLATTWAHIKKQ